MNDYQQFGTPPAKSVLQRGVNIFIPLAVFAAFIGLLMYKSGAFVGKSAHGVPPGFMNGVSVSEALESSDAESQPLVVMFSASWCPPCKRMKAGPLRSDAVQSWLASSGNALYVDIDEHQNEARAHGIDSVPTFIKFEKGKETKRSSGGMGKGAFVKWIDSD